MACAEVLERNWGMNGGPLPSCLLSLRGALGSGLMSLCLPGYRAGAQEMFVTPLPPNSMLCFFVLHSAGTPTRKQFPLQTSSGLSGQRGLLRIAPLGQNLGKWLGLGLLPGLAWTSPAGAGGKRSPGFLTPSPESGGDSRFSHEDTEAQGDGLRPHEESDGMGVGS